MSEEPAVQDAEPVTLESESFLGVLPGPLELSAAEVSGVVDVYQVVEVLYEPTELQQQLDREGWTATIDATRWFIFGEATPR